MPKIIWLWIVVCGLLYIKSFKLFAYKLVIQIVSACGPKTGTMDERPNGFPIQRGWEGVNMLDVIKNKDRSAEISCFCFNFKRRT